MLKERVNIRSIAPEDIDKIQELVKTCSYPLEIYDIYLYRLLAEYFSNTCFVAEAEGEIVGFILGFVSQNDNSIFFLWQFGVLESYRKTHFEVHLPMLLISHEINVAKKMGCQKLQFTLDSGSKMEKQLLNARPGRYCQKKVFLKSWNEQGCREETDILYEIPCSLVRI